MMGLSLVGGLPQNVYTTTNIRTDKPKTRPLLITKTITAHNCTPMSCNVLSKNSKTPIITNMQTTSSFISELSHLRPTYLSDAFIPCDLSITIPLNIATSQTNTTSTPRSTTSTPTNATTTSTKQTPLTRSHSVTLGHTTA